MTSGLEKGTGSEPIGRGAGTGGAWRGACPLFLRAASLYLLMALAVVAADESPAKSKLEKRLQEINAVEARHWQMYVDEAQTKKAELIERPVYYWTNPTKGGGQHGAVFVWTYEGKPLVVGSIFAHPTEGKRRLVHEFHSLAPEILHPQCKDGENTVWQPKAGLKLDPLSDAPKPETTPLKRLRQMKSLGGRFEGYTIDWRKQRWELRLLPQPLYRYEKQEGATIDGALLALVTDAGTDPEILLLLEATKDGWRYALARFTDSSFYVELDKKQVFSAVHGEPDWAQSYNPDRTYHTFQKRFLTEEDLGDVQEETQP